MAEVSGSNFQMGSSRRAGRNRVKYRSAEDSIQLLVATGLKEIITKHGGINVSLDHINLEWVITKTQIPHSTCYRVFPTKEIYVARLIDKAVETSNGPDAQMFNDSDKVNAAELISQTPDMKKLSVASRKSLAATGIGHTLMNNITRLQNIIRPSAIALADSEELPTDRERRSRDIIDVHEATVARAGSFFATMSNRLDLEAKAGTSYPDLASMSVAYLGGVALLPEAFAKSDAFESSMHITSTALVDGYLQAI
ncbi:MAG: hypothetical protein ACREGF_01295 [Candidatus Saccharimonadales bacterium]